MLNETQTEVELLEKIRSLPPNRRAEVVDFVEFLIERQSQMSDHSLTRWTTGLSVGSFQKLWDNPEDDVYNEL